MQLLQHFKELTIRPKNAKELKGLILQLAIQGKLTANWREQNKNIEPASELLNRIQKEKEQLVKEKKIKKEKLLPQIKKNEKPYELADNWEWCRLQDIIKISSGKGLTSAKMDKSGKIPVYGGNGITGYHSIGNVKQPTIVIGRVGFYCGSIHLTEDIAWVTDNAFTTYYSEDNIFRDFLLFLLSGTNLKKDENATAQPVISGRKVYPIVVSLPPLEEQKEIVKVVETLFKEVEQLEQLTVKRINLKEDLVTSALHQLTTNNAKQEWAFLQDHFKGFFNENTNIKKLRETVLQLAVQGKLTTDWRSRHPELVSGSHHASQLLNRIQEEKAQLLKDKKIRKEKALPPITIKDIPYQLPESWVWCRMLDFCYLITDGAHHTPKYVDSGIPFLSVKNLSKGFLDFSDTRFIEKENHLELIKRCNPEYEDILLTKIGTTGIAKVIDTKEDFSIFVSVALLKIAKKELYPEFIEHVINSPFIKNQSSEGTEGVGNKNLVLRKIKAFIVPLPPLEEQKAIVEKVNTLMDLCDALAQEVQQSQEHSEQLMQRVLREVFEEKERNVPVIST